MNDSFEILNNYPRRLIVFYVISIVLHVVFLGGNIMYSSIFVTDGDFSITTYQAGSDENIEEISGNPLDSDEQIKSTRRKIYRVDYFNTLLLETPIKNKIVPEPPKPIEPVIPDKPVEPVKPESPTDDPSEIGEDSESLIADELVGSIMTFDELKESGNSLHFPPYVFDLIPHNENDWISFRSRSCKGHDIVYFMADISKKNGFEEYFEWAVFWDSILSMPGVKDPPTPIGIAQIIEDPYFLTPQLASDAMKRRIEKLEYNEALYRNYNFIDVNGQVLDALGIEELPMPQVYFVDYQGYVRLKLEGRIQDIPIDQMKKAVLVIKELWDMNEIESAFATAAIISYQQKIINEKKNEMKE
jgi:hypothetical protein